MTIARTQIPLVIQPPLGSADRNCVEGVTAKTELFSVTVSSDTTAVIYVGGLIPWRVHNESGAPITLTFYDAGEKNGEANAPYDGDRTAVPSITMADNTSYDITDLAGCLFVVVVGSVAASGIRMVAKR